MIQYQMEKQTKHKTWLTTELIEEIQNRYPDRLPMEERTSFQQGLDVGYQACINEMLSVLEGEDESDED